MKRIVIFKGGLGNQIFQYGMYTYQQAVMGRDVEYMYREADHNGMEIDRYFDVDIRRAPAFYTWLYWVVWRLNKYGLLRRFLFTGKDGDERPCDLFVNGYWQDRRYFMHRGFDIRFKRLDMSGANADVARQMGQTESVAIHVRRGDYLSPANQKLFSACTKDYYMRAIDRCRQTLGQPRFFVFSDDMEWVRANLVLGDAVYVDWNKGDDSVYDMYLMSMAKACIIANSTFSFWGAMLGRRKDLVVYPEMWFANGNSPDIFPDGWVAM